MERLHIGTVRQTGSRTSQLIKFAVEHPDRPSITKALNIR